MHIVPIHRTDEFVIKGKEVEPGMVISTDEDRVPHNIWLVTEVKGGVIRGVYVGDDKDRNRGVQHIVGISYAVVHYPLAALAIHGIPT